MYSFSFPLDSALQQTIDKQIADTTRGSFSAPSVATQLAIGTTDGVIKALALDVIDILKTNGDGAGILGVLSSLLKSTMHMLIKQIMGKVDNSEQTKLAMYLNNRRIVVNGKAQFGFIMPDALGSRFEALLARIAADDFADTRGQLTKLMQEFTAQAVAKFYDEFTGCLDLGFIKRKLVDVGRSTVLAGSNSATSKLFVSMSDADLKNVAAHYGQMFVKS